MNHHDPHAHGKAPAAASLPVVSPSQAIDPVCGMSVDPGKAKATAVHDGQTFYFCCPSCAGKFKADPDRYLKKAPVVEVPAPAGTTWICPMDPEVRQDHPGSCPKCGMALEPE